MAPRLGCGAGSSGIPPSTCPQGMTAERSLPSPESAHSRPSSRHLAHRDPPRSARRDLGLHGSREDGDGGRLRGIGPDPGPGRGASRVRRSEQRHGPDPAADGRTGQRLDRGPPHPLPDGVARRLRAGPVCAVRRWRRRGPGRVGAVAARPRRPRARPPGALDPPRRRPAGLGRGPRRGGDAARRGHPRRTGHGPPHVGRQPGHHPPRPGPAPVAGGGRGGAAGRPVRRACGRAPHPRRRARRDPPARLPPRPRTGCRARGPTRTDPGRPPDASRSGVAATARLGVGPGGP